MIAKRITSNTFKIETSHLHHNKLTFSDIVSASIDEKFTIKPYLSYRLL